MSTDNACNRAPMQPVYFSLTRLTEKPGKFNAPQLLAYAAAILLALASATTNVTSAITKQPDIAGKFIAGSIALAVAALVMIALPAALAALRDRQYGSAALAGLAFAMAASFGVSAALGTLGKPRLEAGLHAEHDGKQRARLDAERNSVLAELATLAPARNAAELNSLIAAKLATPGANGCLKTDGPISTRACSEAASLQSEASRFERISALNGTVTRIDGELSKLGKPGIANGDAAALAAVLAVFGIAVDANAVNVALMCLAVAILEIGSGLSLALAQVLRVAAPTMASMPLTAAPAPTVASPALPAIAQTPIVAEPEMKASPVTRAVADQLAKLVAAHGTYTANSKRELARVLDASPATAARALAYAVTAGLVIQASTDLGEIILQVAA